MADDRLQLLEVAWAAAQVVKKCVEERESRPWGHGFVWGREMVYAQVVGV